MKYRRFLFLLTLALGPLVAQEPARPLAEAAHSLAAEVQAGGIATGERIGEAQSFGSAGKLEPAGVPPEQCIFEIGSITKVFTSLLLAQAVTEGKVTLETTVAALLGPKQHFDDPRVGAITLKQLSTHTSGLPRLPPNLNDGAAANDPYAHYDRAHLLAGVAMTKLTGEASFPVSYSNYGAGLLGDLLAQVYGQPWEELVRQKITVPLGMADTAVVLTAEQQKRLVPPFAGEKPAHAWSLKALVAAGGLHSTTRDLLKLGAALLAPEKSPFPKALALQLQPQTTSGEIGLGIFRGGSGEGLFYNHAGGTGGYGSFFQVSPAEKSVRVVLVNNSAFAPGKVLAALHPAPAAPKEAAHPLTEAQATEYAGIYRLDDLQRFTAVARGAELWVRLTGQPFFRIFPGEKAERFFYKVVPAELEFRREEGKPAGLTLYQNGGELHATRSGPPPELLFLPHPELEQYTGAYQLAPGVAATISIQSDTLYAQLTGQPAAPVFATKRDHFEFDVVKAELDFERDQAGKVIAFTLHQNGRDLRALKTR